MHQPHGLDVGDIEGVNEILEDDPQLYDSFRTLFGGHLAQATHESYDWIIRPFRRFCEIYGKFISN